MADIFISYNGGDREFVGKVVQLLEAAGWSVWWDRRIPTGKTWRTVIDGALADMKCMIVFWSKNSVGSEWVIEEAEEGRQRRVLLPVLVHSVAPPRGFREIQAQDFQDWDGTAEAPCFRMLLQDMREIVDASANASRPITIEQAPNSPDDTSRGLATDQKAAPLTASRPPAADVLAHAFCLPWPSRNRASARIRNALVLVTDYRSLTASDLSNIATHCKEAGKSLVVVAPSLVGPEIDGVTCPADLAIEARNVDGQPMEELLADLAAYLGGYALSREWGFGLPQKFKPQDLVNGIVRTFMQIGDADVYSYLCKASEIWVQGNQLCFEAERPLPDVRQQIAYLKSRALHCSPSHEEFKGLRERLRRFDATEPIAGSVVPPTSFTQDGERVTLPAGMASRFFMNADGCCRLGNPKVLVASFPLRHADDVVPALEASAADAMADRNRLIVIAPRIEDEARALLVINTLRGIVGSLGVETQSSEQLSALARLTGARLIDEEDADHLSSISVRRVLGSAREVVSEFHRTRIAQ